MFDDAPLETRERCCSMLLEDKKKRHRKATAAGSVLPAGDVLLRSRSVVVLPSRFELARLFAGTSRLLGPQSRRSRSDILRGAAARRKFCAGEGPAASILAPGSKLRLR